MLPARSLYSRGAWRGCWKHRLLVQKYLLAGTKVRNVGTLLAGRICTKRMSKPNTAPLSMTRGAGTRKSNYLYWQKSIFLTLKTTAERIFICVSVRTFVPTACKIAPGKFARGYCLWNATFETALKRTTRNAPFDETHLSLPLKARNMWQWKPSFPW